MKRYLVLNEEMLGIMRDAQTFVFEILFCRGRSPLDSLYPAPVNGAGLRSATQADFDRFRVCSKGHIA